VAFVYEAGPTGFGLYDDLVANNQRCLVVAPSMVPTAPGQRVKTNRLDGKKLSIGLRGGELRSIHVRGAQLSRAAAPGAIARHAGAAVNGHQITDQITAAL